MGAISNYSRLLTGVQVIQSPILESPKKDSNGKPILKDAKEIALAQYDVDTKDAITAHNLKDYRRRRFNLIMLPKVDIAFDKILEGSEYWNGLLHNESAYS